MAVAYSGIKTVSRPIPYKHLQAGIKRNDGLAGGAYNAPVAHEKGLSCLFKT